MRGTLSPNQSRYLGGLFSTPLFSAEGYERLKPAVLEAYLESELPENEPADLPNDIKLIVQWGFATGKKYVEMDSDEPDGWISHEDVVAQTPSPFPKGEEIDIEDDDEE